MIHRFYYYIVRNYYLLRYPKKVMEITPSGFDFWEEEFYKVGDRFSWNNSYPEYIYIGNNYFLPKDEL